MDRLVVVFRNVLTVAVACWIMAGCIDDFGSPCDFPQSPEVQHYCGSRQDEQGNQSFATCVDPFNPDCQSQVCVTFEGSEAFCSEHCDQNSDCPDSSWCEIPMGASQGVCIPNDKR